MEEKVTIDKKEYDELVKDSEFLQALQEAGVDNWGGYSFAVEILKSYDENGD